MPEVSLVMALYNTPFEIFKKTIKSILSQTFRDFELIIIDDSSSLDYHEFLKTFNDKRIKYIKSEKNFGPGHARNEGIKKAQSEIIAIVDSDDIYLPYRLELQLNFLKNNPEISLVSGAFKYSNNGKIPVVPQSDEEIKVFMLFNAPLANPIVMFRRDVFLEKSLFYPNEPRFGEDYELWIDAMFAGIKMANLKDILMIYTRRSGQLSKAKSDFQILSLKEIYKKMLSRFGLAPTAEEIELHYNIYAQNFNEVKVEQVQQWVEKIIEQNKKTNLLSEDELTRFMNETVKKIIAFRDRLFKIKIGQYNLCLSKRIKLYIEKRD